LAAVHSDARGFFVAIAKQHPFLIKDVGIDHVLFILATGLRDSNVLLDHIYYGIRFNNLFKASAKEWTVT